MALDIVQRTLEIGQDLRAKSDNPRRAIGKAQGTEGDNELAEVVARVEYLHRGTERRFAVVDQQEVSVADVLEVELDDFIGRIDFFIAEIPPQRVEQDKTARQTLLGSRTPVLSRGGIGIHNGSAEVDLHRIRRHGSLKLAYERVWGAGLPREIC